MEKIDTQLISLFAVGLITAIALIGIFNKMKDGFGPFNLKVYGLTLVLGVTGILTLSDIDSTKLTAAFSIIGAVAGYLFGLKKTD
jgi:hypothetical protein